MYTPVSESEIPQAKYILLMAPTSVYQLEIWPHELYVKGNKYDMSGFLKPILFNMMRHFEHFNMF